MWPPGEQMKPYFETKLGRLYNGDCLSVLAEIEDESVDMIWTDPPYGHKNHDGDLNAQLNKHRGIQSKPIANDDAEGFRAVLDGMLNHAARIMRKTSSVCCCCGGGGPRPTFAYVANRMDTGGLQFFHSVIWDKRNPGLGWRYRRQHEMVMVAHREGGKLAWASDDVTMRNIISFSPPRNRLHPNEKPLDMVKLFISLHTQRGDLVIDPFGGSGTTAVACEELGRRWVCIELDEEYCQITKNRLTRPVQPSLLAL